MGEILGVFSINWKLLVIQMINFGLLLAVLYKFLYKPLLEMMAKRVLKIEQGVKDADEAGEQLNKTKEKEKKIIALASEEAVEIVNLSRGQAESVKNKILKEADSQKEKMMIKANERAVDIKEKMIKESQEEIAKMTVLGVEKILKHSN